jgi:hypothetical protein
VPSEAEALQLLASGAHDPRRSAVLVGAPDNGADAVPGSGAIVSLIVVEEAPELVRVDLPQDGRGVVVLADAWAPGWSALVDGKPRRLWQANYFGRGVLVHPGDHTIEFRYEPPGVRSGAYIALASLAAAALLARTRAAKGS